MARVNRDDLDRFHDYGIYLPKRAIYMGSEIVGEDDESGTDALMAERAIKSLMALDAQSNDEILIILNNLGGSTTHGLAIYDFIKSCNSHVTIKVFGSASSMGSVILQAGDTRIMSENSIQMVHYGFLGISGENKTVYKYSDEAKRVDKWMEKMYLHQIQIKQPLYKLGRLQRMLGNDTHLTARQSVDLGLCDFVLGEEK